MSKDANDEISATSLDSAPTAAEPAKPTKKAKAVRTLEDEIIELQDKLRRKQEEKRLRDLRDRERNLKQIQELIRSHRLDTVPAAAWESAMPKILELLKVKPLAK